MHWKVAGILLAATAGTAVTPGREIALFFSQMGGTSWLAVAIASAGFGGMCALFCELARRTVGRTVTGVLVRSVGMGVGRLAAVIHGLLVVCIAVMMFVRCGHMAALVLPVQNAFWMGVIGALLAALWLNFLRLKKLAALSAVALTTMGIYLAALWLDGREIVYVRNYEVFPALEGSVWAAIAFGLLHAALNACAAAGTVVWIAKESISTRRLGICCGAGMAILLSLANGAILRGGKRLLNQAVPLALLATRWGKCGFYLSSAMEAIGSILTLAAMVRSFVRRT